jgi:hypothetical protein
MLRQHEEPAIFDNSGSRSGAIESAGRRAPGAENSGCYDRGWRILTLTA